MFEGKREDSRKGRQPMVEFRPAVLPRRLFSIGLLVVLSFGVALGLNGVLEIFHEYGHYIVARIFASSRVVFITQPDTVPPFLWFSGYATFIGNLGWALGPFYYAPALTTILPWLIAGLVARRKPSIPLIGARNALFVAWLLLTFRTLFPSPNSSSVGPSDGALLLGKAGLDFAMSNPVALFVASYPGWVIFRLGWWTVAVYLTSRVFFRKAQLSFIILFSILSFLTFAAIALFLPV
jgi:hypothetical protein